MFNISLITRCRNGRFYDRYLYMKICCFTSKLRDKQTREINNFRLTNANVSKHQNQVSQIGYNTKWHNTDTRRMSLMEQELLTFPGHTRSQPVFYWVRVALVFSFLCCVFFCLCPVSCVPNVASFSWLFILDFPFSCI
jgi:hypothetical protein